MSPVQTRLLAQKCTIESLVPSGRQCVPEKLYAAALYRNGPIQGLKKVSTEKGHETRDCVPQALRACSIRVTPTMSVNFISQFRKVRSRPIVKYARSGWQEWCFDWEDGRSRKL